jgi:hypothetical protein
MSIGALIGNSRWLQASSAVAFSLLYISLCRILRLVLTSRRAGSDKDIEIMVLRHQVRVLERQLPARVKYRPADRAILVPLSRLLPRTRWRSFWFTADTLLRWHREAAKYRWLRRGKQRGPGRPPMSDELVGLIVRLGRDNRRWGASASRESSESLGSGSRPVRSDGSCADMAWGPHPEVGPRGRSSFGPRPTACSPRTSSRWTPCHSSSSTCSS